MSLIPSTGGSFSVPTGGSTVEDPACVRESFVVGAQPGQMFVGVCRFNNESYTKITSREDAETVLQALLEGMEVAFGKRIAPEQPYHAFTGSQDYSYLGRIGRTALT